MDDIKVKGGDWSPVKDPTNASHDNKIHLVFGKGFEDGIKIRCGRGHLSTSEWNGWFAVRPAIARQVSKRASSG
jgi:hypothetical protein